MRVFITGLGVISAIGDDVQANLSGLLEGKPKVAPAKNFNTVHTDLPVAEIIHSNETLVEMTGLPQPPQCTRTGLLAIKAAKEAVESAGISISSMMEFKTGLLSGNSVGGMDKTETRFSQTDKTDPEFYDFVDTHDCGNSTEAAAIALGIGDFTTTISTACSSSANTIMQGARLIKSGRLERAIAGGCDALSKFTLNGFNSLMILSKQHCKPFDAARTGLNLGEGAGFMVLESEAVIEKTGKTPICEITGYDNVNEAFHATASSPLGDGAFAAMQGALKMGGISPEEISYINAHGTGTENNDQAEGMAIKRLFGEVNPLFSSTKTFTGHTLGAAGGIEAVFSALAISNNAIFPNLNFRTPIEDVGLKPVTGVVINQSVQHVLSNSFGFGGNNTSLLFSKC